MKINLKRLGSEITNVLKALDRDEEVGLFHRGKLKAVIKPQSSAFKRKITEHPFFNMDRSTAPVKVKMSHLRDLRVSPAQK